MADEERFGAYDPNHMQFDPETEKALVSIEKAAKKAIIEYESYFQLDFDAPLD